MAEKIVKDSQCLVKDLVNDCISRQAAIDAQEAYMADHPLDGYEDELALIDILRNLPSAQPERKTGKWNAYYHGINETPSFTYSCNQCGYSAPYGLYGGKYSQKKWNFCPNCGAKMRGEQDG